ncbi:TlpA family protein disulfide reductase [Legionella moravica]|nr:TlpA disulfide reductase family protein [Legionella moravica]
MSELKAFISALTINKERVMRACALISLFICALMPSVLFAVGEGSAVPAISLPLMSNPATKVNIANIKAKYILIDFWASWCASCRQSMSELSSLSKSLNSKGLKVVGINTDKDPAAAKQFLKMYPSSFSHLSDPDGTAAKQFGLSKMPTSYLIGPDKKIIRVFPGYDAGNSAIIKGLVK